VKLNVLVLLIWHASVRKCYRVPQNVHTSQLIQHSAIGIGC